MTKTFAALAIVGVAGLGAAAAVPDEDPFQWLEDVKGEKPLAWAREQNAKTLKVLEARPEYKPIYARTLEILDSKDKIPTPELLGEAVYNFWKDDAHERGIWRRTTIASYRAAAPRWETVLDVDALAKADGKPWVFHGATCLAPANERCMVSLSPGGSDASVEREFDTKAKEFVSGGFVLPEAKSFIAWRDENTLWLGTDFGSGSLTSSGYPRIVKLWKRGTPVSAARTVFEGRVEDVGSGGRTEILSDGRYDLITRTPAFFREETFLLLGDRLVRLDLPEDARPRLFFRDRLLLSLRSDWTVGGKTYREGSLLAGKVDDLLGGLRRFDVLFEPSERVSLAALVFVNRCQNLKGEHNDRPWAKLINDGSFIYTGALGGATKVIDKPLDNGTLPGYGSMTYAGVKSMIYCGVSKDDPRVKKAYEWIQNNYTVDRNPGMPETREAWGLYYYYNTMAKSLDTLGIDYVVDAKGVKHDWRKDITEALAKRQRPDGSFQNSAANWMEADQNLVTGYALMALSYCRPK